MDFKMKTPVKLWPLESRIRSAINQRRTMDDLCISKTIICPEEHSKMPPITMRPEHRARVTASQLETTLDKEWQRIEGYEAQHKATVRYEFANVLATPNGFFVTGNGFNQLGQPPMKDLLSAKIHHAKKGLFGPSPISMKYFGHWLRDCLPSTLLKQPDEELYFPLNPTWSHAKKYADLFEIDRHEHEYVLFETMSFCVDIGQNSSRRARTKVLKERLQAKLPSGHKRVYISRGTTGVSRVLVNEIELISALKDVGFTIVSASAPLEDILEACAGSDVTISMEGSHMAHAFYPANPNALLMTINPADRFNNVFADYMPSFDLRLATFVADTCDGGYRVDIPELLGFVAENADIRP
jgi:hypothetical protein